MKKCSINSAVVEGISGEQEEQEEQEELVDDFRESSAGNRLLLKVYKMMINFRRKTTITRPVCILGPDADVMEEYRYQGEPPNHSNSYLNVLLHLHRLHCKTQAA